MIDITDYINKLLEIILFATGIENSSCFRFELFSCLYNKIWNVYVFVQVQK